MSWLVSKLRGKAEGASPDVSGHGAQEQDDLLTIRLLHAQDQEEEGAQHGSHNHVSFRGDDDEDEDDLLFPSSGAGSPPVLGSSAPDQQGLLSTFRSFAATTIGGGGHGGFNTTSSGNSSSRRPGDRPSQHERAASASDIAGYASRALNRAVSREEVETLLGPPPHHYGPPGTHAATPNGGDSAGDYYSAEDFRRTLSAKIDAARRAFDPSMQLRLLTFNDVSCSYRAKGKKGPVTVLKGVSGLVAPGWMVAIMGPSGAGKSTMLDILAMRKTVGTLTGDILVNGVARDASFHQFSSYVAQEDVFLPTLSVRQTLRYYMDLRLGPGLPGAVKERRMRRLLKEVGLGAKARAMVGGPLAGGLSIRGLSGGEKRRLSICCGTVAKPSLLFLDEPTSGLDAMSALLVMEVMKRHARRGMGVVCTIHQPRPSIWSMFDKLLLLSEGRLVFFSDTRQVLPWFCGSLGYARPSDSSASDFVLDLVNVSFEKEGQQLLLAPGGTAGGAQQQHDDHDDDALDLSASATSSYYHQQQPNGKAGGVGASGAGGGGGLSTMTTVAELDEAARRFLSSPLLVELRALEVLYVFHLTALGVYGHTNSSSKGGSGAGRPRGHAHQGGGGGCVGWMRSSWSCFRLLLWRSVINYVRNPGNVLARVFVTALTAVLHGLAFYRLEPSDVSNRLGSLFFGCTSLSLLPYASMSLFIYDRQFFAKDSAAGLYGVLPYYLSSVLLEAALLAGTGLLYAAITHAMVHQVVEDGQGSFGVLAGVYVAHSLVSSQFVQLMAILAPNQDVGFVSGAGYTSASMLVCGFLVAYPQLGQGLRWMQWVSFMKYSFAALAMNEFKGTKVETAVIAGMLELERPHSIGQHVGCLAAFGAFFALAAVMGLTFLHKEKR